MLSSNITNYIINELISQEPRDLSFVFLIVLCFPIEATVFHVGEAVGGMWKGEGGGIIRF